jgi:hypothetical protein
MNMNIFNYWTNSKFTKKSAVSQSINTYSKVYKSVDILSWFQISSHRKVVYRRSSMAPRSVHVFGALIGTISLKSHKTIFLDERYISMLLTDSRCENSRFIINGIYL